MIVMEIQSEGGVQTTWTGDPSPWGFPDMAGHIPEDQDTENGASCAREGLPASSFCLTQERFSSSSSS